MLFAYNFKYIRRRQTHYNVVSTNNQRYIRWTIITLDDPKNTTFRRRRVHCGTSTSTDRREKIDHSTSKYHRILDVEGSTLKQRCERVTDVATIFRQRNNVDPTSCAHWVAAKPISYRLHGWTDKPYPLTKRFRDR